MKKVYIALLVILVIALLYTFTFNMSPAEITALESISYSPDGFVDAMELSDRDKLVASNSNFELYVDETTSHFEVKDLSTDTIWNSNPQIIDPWVFDLNHSITKAAQNKQKATLELSYFNDKGSQATINNYELSISHPASVLYSAGLRTYSIKYVENGFQVKYVIEDIDIDYLYFPKYLTPEALGEFTSGEREILEGLAYLGYDEELGVYVITQYEDMSRLVRKELYKIFYEDNDTGYTRERAIEENKTYGYEETFEKVRFEIALQIELTDDGVKTSVIKDSIVEPDNAKLANVSLYPHFGAAVSHFGANEIDGYIVVPDGTGAVMEFNNGKYYQQPYVKRLYGQDFAMLDHKMPEAQQDISMPLFGMVREDVAYAAIITKGDAMASINADVSGRIDSYNKVYPSFHFRESEAVTIGAGYNSYGLDLWSEERVDTDFTVAYSFLSGDQANYIGMAKVYQDYLTDNFGLSDKDDTNETVLTTELLGSYDQKEFLFGVPYSTNESLTTFDEAEVILNELLERDITNINVMYSGMINGGLSSSISDEFDVERVIGGNRNYKQFLTYLEEQEIDLYPVATLLTASEYNKMFDRFRYTSSRLDRSQSMNFTYHLPSKLPYSETPFQVFEDDYVISPYYYNEVLEGLLKDYKQDRLAFTYLGNSLGGDYSDNMLYKQDALHVQADILANMEEEVLLINPLGYALGYADEIVDLPTETTLYAILDYQIPLLQLVLSGKVDYATSSLNMANNRSVEYNFLKAIETGSNIKYTLTYDDSKELKDSQFSYYLSTQYENWTDRIESQIKELDDLGIHQGYLVNHERIQNNVYKVTYSHGLEILINYNVNDVTLEDNSELEALSYIVLEVN